MIKFPDFPVETPEHNIDNAHGTHYTFVWRYMGEGAEHDTPLKHTSFYYTGEGDLLQSTAAPIDPFVAAARHSLLQDLFMESAEEMAYAMLEDEFTDPQHWFDDHIFTEGWVLVDAYKGMHHSFIVDAVNKVDFGK